MSGNSREYNQARIAAFKSQGLCWACSGKEGVIDGQTLGQSCKAKKNARIAAMRASGVCSDHAAPLINKTQCAECKTNLAQRNKARYEQMVIRPRKDRKRGRVLKTESGKLLSHEELAIALIKKTALECAANGLCGCGKPFNDVQGKNATMCVICAYKRHLKTNYSRHAHKVGVRGSWDRTPAEWAKQAMDWYVKRKSKQEAYRKRKGHDLPSPLPA